MILCSSAQFLHPEDDERSNPGAEAADPEEVREQIIPAKHCFVGMERHTFARVESAFYDRHTAPPHQSF